MTPTSRGINAVKLRRLAQDRTFEVALSKYGLGPVAGVDEAGRGACAGPIVIAACILPDRIVPELDVLTDSKKLTPNQREKLFPVIQKVARSYAITVIDAGEIDDLGIQHANISGMRRAVAALELRPGYVLTDAMKVPGFATPYLPIIGGDSSSRCIAAASVLAKVTRDRIMFDLSHQYPEYEFDRHKGYGTKTHMAAVARYGACPVHRVSYANVAAAQAQFRAGNAS